MVEVVRVVRWGAGLEVTPRTKGRAARATGRRRGSGVGWRTAGRRRWRRRRLVHAHYDVWPGSRLRVSQVCGERLVVCVWHAVVSAVAVVVGGCGPAAAAATTTTHVSSHHLLMVLLVVPETLVSGVKARVTRRRRVVLHLPDGVQQAVVAAVGGCSRGRRASASRGA